MATKLYCSVSGKTKQVTKLYCSVNITQSISLSTYLAGADPAAFTTAAQSYAGTSGFASATLYQKPYMKAKKSGSYLYLYFNTSYATTGTYLRFSARATLSNFLNGYTYGNPGFTYASGKTATDLSTYLWGLSDGSSVNVLRFGVGRVSRKVTKLYASVNGVTKLVFEG